MLTLLGLVLAIGLVVDDAIVVLENVHRRTELGAPPLVAAITGAHEIGFAVIATTLTLASVFVPISFLPGDLGRLFREFGFTLAASRAVLGADRAHAHADARVAAAGDDWPQGFARRSIDALPAASRGSTSGVCASSSRTRGSCIVGCRRVLIGVGVVTFLSVPREFAPTADLGRAFITIEAPEGSSFDYMDGYARQLEAITTKEMQESGEIERFLIRVPGAGRRRHPHRRRQHGARDRHLEAVGTSAAHGAGGVARDRRGGAEAARRARVHGPAPEPRPPRRREQAGASR